MRLVILALLLGILLTACAPQIICDNRECFENAIDSCIPAVFEVDDAIPEFKDAGGIISTIHELTTTYKIEKFDGNTCLYVIEELVVNPNTGQTTTVRLNCPLPADELTKETLSDLTQKYCRTEHIAIT